MMRIFKYIVAVHDNFVVELPEGAIILSVQVQAENPVMWCLVDPENPKVLRQFAVHGTGHQVINHEKKKYIGTFQMFEGKFVGHLFEVL